MPRRDPFAHSPGRIEVICGPMFSGKTEALLQHANLMRHAQATTMVVKPAVDVRGTSKAVASRDGRQVKAETVANERELRQRFFDLPKESRPAAVYVDEVQFFGDGLPAVVTEIANAGCLVVCAGLDTDFRGEPFGPMPKLLALAESVDKRAAACTVCGGRASRSQRLVDGKPAGYADPSVVIGDRETYQARCREHHVVPKP